MDVFFFVSGINAQIWAVRGALGRVVVGRLGGVFNAARRAPIIPRAGGRPGTEAALGLWPLLRVVGRVSGASFVKSIS